MGRRAAGIWAAKDALQSLRAMGGQRRLGRSVRSAGALRRPKAATDDRLLGRKGPPLGGGRKRGEKNQAIGRSRGGRTTKIHALTDEHCRPLAFLITGGNVADCTAGASLIDRLPKCDVVNADKGYDSDALRAQIRDRGALPNIPPKANRKEK